MRTRTEIYYDSAKAYDRVIGIQDTEQGLAEYNQLILETLLDIRDILADQWESELTNDLTPKHEK
jgi:hypothetical protein